MPTRHARPRLAARSASFGLAALLGLVSALAGCGPSGAPAPASAPALAPGERLAVVCTTGMIADAARVIAGEHADVVALMGPGTDPHLYTPTRTDLAAIMDADVVFYNGLHLEGRMIEALRRAESAGKRVVAVTELLSADELLAPPEFNGLPDPHVWMDPSTWVVAVDGVARAMSEADPSSADEYATNAASYRAQVEALDIYAAETLATVPKNRRALVTAHDAFNYFGRRYGFVVIGIQGISTESEAGVRDIERLVSMLVDQKIPAVFVETTVSERNIRALIDGAKARGHDVVIGGLLYSDAMGQPGTYEGTYPGMIDHNVTTIVRALGGQAPARGMSGQLMEGP
ncbi:MAG: manganese/zinc/iron transport system substrate-binding protein [Phycisphaerales bacterium]|jgi:manganese/zinc/iron transport system substrate-binding protein